MQSVLGFFQEVNPDIPDDEKVSHPIKSIAENIYQVRRQKLTQQLISSSGPITSRIWNRKVLQGRFERLPNVIPVATVEDESNLISLLRLIVQEDCQPDSWTLRSL